MKIKRFTLLLFLLIGLPMTGTASNLERLANTNLPNFELLDVEHRSGFLAITGGLMGTSIVDVRDPANPFAVEEYHDANCLYSRLYNTFIGEGIFAGGGRNCPIPILSIDEGRQLTVQSYHRTESFNYEDVAIVGDTLLVAAAHTAGIEIVDISNPRFPATLGIIPLNNAWAVRVEGEYAYVADDGFGLSIVDFSDPTDPRVVGQLPTEGSPKDIRVRNGYVFLALGDAGIAMIDVSDPASPFLAAQYNTSGLASHIGVNDSLVAVADWDDVEILKYGSGGTLELVGRKNDGKRVMGVEISDDIVYVAEWNQLRIYRFGEIAGADLDISLMDIHFPRTNIGSSVDTTIVFTNDGKSTLTIQSIDVSFDDFSLDLKPPFDVLPGGQRTVTITYTPTILDGQRETITFNSNDTDDPSLSVVVWGNDVDLRVGDPAPDFTLPLLDGGEVTLSELRGQIVVLSFFASW